jgi:predicted lipase
MITGEKPYSYYYYYFNNYYNAIALFQLYIQPKYHKFHHMKLAGKIAQGLPAIMVLCSNSYVDSCTQVYNNSRRSQTQMMMQTQMSEMRDA